MNTRKTTLQARESSSKTHKLVFPGICRQLNKAEGALIQVLDLLEVRMIQERILLITHVVSGDSFLSNGLALSSRAVKTGKRLFPANAQNSLQRSLAVSAPRVSFRVALIPDSNVQIQIPFSQQVGIAVV